MAYFPNGITGEMYEAQYCDKCMHQEGCTVWLAHMLRNYEECNNDSSILHILIPMDEWHNAKQCTMFIASVNLTPP